MLIALRIILGSLGMIFSSKQLLSAEQVFHPALVVKMDPARNSFQSEKAYISFTGCATNNKSLIDELPAMRNHLYALTRQIGKLSKLRSHISELRRQIGKLPTLRSQLSEMKH